MERDREREKERERGRKREKERKKERKKERERERKERTFLSFVQLQRKTVFRCLARLLDQSCSQFVCVCV